MDSKQFKEAATLAIDESMQLFESTFILKLIRTVVSYYNNIQDRRVVSNVNPGYLKNLLPDGPPQEGEPWADIQNDIESKIMPGLTHW
jgi:aromatic-L-amino-acid/L-tryptophan decarboxylase